MKDKFGCLLKRSGWIFMVGLLSISLFLAGCSKQTTTSKFIKINNVATASSITTTNGEQDWRNFTQQKNFSTGYRGDFWVMFEFSNVLHNNNINVKINIYIVSGGILEDEASKYVDQTDATDNTLYWGNKFDISKYNNGDYTVIVTMTDLISATSATMTNTFTIGS
jgi:hypothetical protein